MVETSYHGLPKYPYKTLMKKILPDDVDDTNKHVSYLRLETMKKISTSLKCRKKNKSTGDYKTVLVLPTSICISRSSNRPTTASLDLSDSLYPSLSPTFPLPVFPSLSLCLCLYLSLYHLIVQSFINPLFVFQNHLTEKQFRENLKLSRQEFYSLPVWKQRQILSSARLLYSPTADR